MAHCITPPCTKWPIIQIKTRFKGMHTKKLAQKDPLWSKLGILLSGHIQQLFTVLYCIVAQTNLWDKKV